MYRKITANEKIRSAMKDNNIAQWQVAKLMGISEITLCRKLREELPEEEQQKILDLIRKEGSCENE